MSASSDLIERAERETGTRATDDGSAAQAVLMGALARMMGQSSHRERDDFAAGILLQNSSEIAKREEQERMAARLFMVSLGIELDD
ncbi:MAG: hypothetical protein KDD89_15775 [Anaerolineales bacterium]|nr:hypothetical protein [Anaerolineales bacterium]